MPITAKLRYLRIAPRKVRMVADLIKGKTARQAQTILTFISKRAAEPFLKLLKSALANAKNNFQIEEAGLYISKILTDEGPKHKRWRARARGRAAEIQKKTSHISLVLDTIQGEKPRKTRKAIKIKKAKEAEKKQSSFKVSKSPEGILKTEEKKPGLRAKRIFFDPRIKKTKRVTKKVFRRKAF